MDPGSRSKGKGRGKGKGNEQAKAEAIAELQRQALEVHGPSTVWYFRNGRDGDHYVFSNFHELREPFLVTVHDPITGISDGIWYPSTEHAYQAAKTLDLEIRWKMSGMRNGSEVKKFANSGRLTYRSDWYDISIDIMKDLVQQKFEDPKLRKILLDTGDAYMMEGNTWRDDFWGKVVKNEQLVGKNNLGYILMSLRDAYRREAAAQATDRPKRLTNVYTPNHQVPAIEEFPELGTSQPSKAHQLPQQIVAPAPSPADQVHSMSAQGKTSSSSTDPAGQGSTRHIASALLSQPGAHSDDSKQASSSMAELLARKTTAIPTQRRRWNRVKELPNDSEEKVDIGRTLIHAEFQSPVIDKEVRRLQKALREIARLESQVEVLSEAGGRLRQNQMQKIAKKQEYLQKLQELGVPASVSDGS